MAYINQAKKQVLSVGIKKVCEKYRAKCTVRIENYSTLVVTITSSPFDFKGDSVNLYWINNNFSGSLLGFLVELRHAMQGTDFYDYSDISTDYFNVSHYTKIKVGTNKKPYKQI